MERNASVASTTPSAAAGIIVAAIGSRIVDACARHGCSGKEHEVAHNLGLLRVVQPTGCKHTSATPRSGC
jgi:hypothetical protein